MIGAEKSDARKAAQQMKIIVLPFVELYASPRIKSGTHKLQIAAPNRVAKVC